MIMTVNNESRRRDLHDKLIYASNKGLMTVSNDIIGSLFSGNITEEELEWIEEKYNRLMNSPEMFDPARIIDNVHIDMDEMTSFEEIIENNKTLNVIGGSIKTIEREKYNILSWIYFHGTLASKLGREMVYLDKGTDKGSLLDNDSVALKVNNQNNGDVYDAIGFFWKDISDEDCGLIVETTDYPAIKYAIEMKEKRSDNL